MELFSPLKIFTLIICFEVIFPVTNINKTSEVENYSLKVIKQFEPISYLSQDSKNIYQDSKIDIDQFKIDVPVKYVYINNYDIYDISGLLKKSLREEIDYSAILNSTKIIYNFKDLKKTDQCNYDEKQIFGISNYCQPLAGPMGNGNSWNITFDNDGRKIIQIKLNPENDKTSVTYLLKCSNIKNYHINEEKSSYESYNGITNLVLYIETAYACPTYEKFVLLEWIDYFHYFLGVLFIIAFFLITLGSIQPEVSYAMLYFLILFLSIVSFVKIFFPPMMRFWKIWLILISCFIFSFILLLTFVLFLNKIFFKYTFGVFLGFFLGQYFYDLFIEVIVWDSLFFYLLFIILFILIGVTLSHFSIYTAAHIASSYVAAYILLRGVSQFGGYFPSEYILVFLKISGEVGQIGKLITSTYYAYNCVSFILGTFIFIMHILAKKDHWNQEFNFN